jgi:regulator of sirC expression with transglutaminase-like and TPR domain
MVEYTPQGSRFSLAEYNVIEKNLALVAHPRFRAKVVQAMHQCISTQVRQRVRVQMTGALYETPRTVMFSPEMSEEVIDSLRSAAYDEEKGYIVARQALQQIVEGYDETHRAAIIAAQHPQDRLITERY